jgi:hypothetical protein
MSDQPAVIAPAPASGPVQADADGHKLFPIHRSWTIATVVAVIMVLLALVGVGLTTTSSSFAATYWICLVPVYGLLCIGTALLRVGAGGHLQRNVVIRQTLHWVGIAIALGLDFYVRGSGEETGVATGLNALLVLALGCYLAGVHLEWLFAVVGVLLTLALVIVAKADQYLWLIFVVGGLTVAVMIALHWLMLTAARKKGATVASSGS